MKFTRGVHHLDPKEFPPSPNWVWDLPQTSVSIEIIDGPKVYEFPGDYFMAYYIQEVGFQPPRDFVRYILSECSFPFFQLGEEDMEDKVNFPIGFLRKNGEGIIVNTFGSDSNLLKGKRVFLHTLPKIVEKELLSRIAQIHQAHQARKNIQLPSSPALSILKEYTYPAENLFADSLWELGRKYSDSFQGRRIGWTEDASPDFVYPAVFLLFQEKTPADNLKAHLQALCLEDKYLKDVSYQLGGDTAELGVALAAVHPDPFYLEKGMNKLILSAGS